MSSDEVNLEESDYPLAIKIFSFLRWGMVFCSVASLVIGIVLLFKGYAWYFVIPGYVVINLFFRVLKSYFRNIAEDLQAEQDALGQQTF